MAKTIKQRDINLLAALDRNRGKSKTSSGTKVAVILALVIVVLALAAAGVFYYLQMAELSGQRDDSYLFLNDPTTQQKIQEANVTALDADSMEAQANAITGAINNLDTYPLLTGDIYKNLYLIAGKPVKVTDIAYDWNTGILTFTGECDSATRVPIFIATLRMSSLFKDVTYQGYQGRDDTTEGKVIVNPDGSETQTTITLRKYKFIVTCLMFAPDEMPAVTTQGTVTQ
jgi:Tfp pilus assembly protein PilN